METLAHYTQRSVRIFADFLTDCVGLLYPAKKNYLPALTDPLLLQPTTVLTRKIRTGQLKSEDLVRAYIERIKAVNPLVNALIGERFNAAIEEAIEWDQKITNREIDGESLPLLGIPVTIKECHAVKDMPFTGGLYSRKDIRAPEDSKVVQNLRKAGAIPIGVTNVPEFLLFWDCSNKIYGQTNNPYDSSRICGGSSGGEAALISSAGSLVGVGSDLGGSLRIPTFYCGVYGHKPTSDIIPATEVFPYVGHKDREKFFHVGPICRYASDLRTMMKGCAGDGITRIDIDKQLDLNDLRVYYMESDGDPLKTMVSDDITSAMQRVLSHLDTKTKVEAQRANLKHMKDSFLIWVCSLANYEAPYLSQELTERTGCVNGWAELCKWAVGRSHFRLTTTLNVILYNILNPDKNRKTEDFKRFVDKGEELRDQITEMLGTNGVFIYPTLPERAPKHNQTLFKGNYCGYTMIFNITGHPVTQVPLGLGSDGLPVGLQIVTNPYNDHLSIGVAELLEKQFGGWVPPFEVKINKLE